MPDIVTPFDTVPDFSWPPTVTSVQNGSWSDPSVWDLGRIPQAEDKVWIQHRLDYSLPESPPLDAIGIRAGGSLHFPTDATTRIRLTNLLILPGGGLYTGQSGEPVVPEHRTEVWFRDVAPTDVKEYGTGLLCWGTMKVSGAPKTPFLRAVDDVLIGTGPVTLQLNPVGWRPGDYVLFPPTKPVQYTDGLPLGDWLAEVESIYSISGPTFNLYLPLHYDHPCGRNLAGSIVGRVPVANLTRNVLFASENPTGNRGHVFWTHRADVDIRYAEFADLGRTRGGTEQLAHNQIGRYAWHAHHLWGPRPDGSYRPYQYRLRGCVVRNATKWGLAVHDSHYGLIQDNVIFGCDEAGIALEDGSESYNYVGGNLVVRVGREQAYSDYADGLWIKGIKNYFFNNSVFGCARDNRGTGNGGVGYHVDYLSLGPTEIPRPLFRGADLTNPAERLMVNPLTESWLDFSGNEAAGCDAAFWDDHHVGPPEGKLVEDLLCWNSHGGLGSIYGGSIHFTGLRVYGAIRVGWFQQSVMGPITSKGGVIECLYGPAYQNIAGASETNDYTLEDMTLAGDIGVLNCLAGSTGASVDKDLHHKTLTCKNLTVIARIPYQYEATLYGQPSVVPVLRNEFVVYPPLDGGSPLPGVRLYLDPAQLPEAVVPSTEELIAPEGTAKLGAPEPGQTNAYWDALGWAVGGKAAPCTFRHPDYVDAVVCSI